MRVCVLFLLPWLAACVHTGHVRLGAPRVHDSETTKALLRSGGALISKEIRAADAGAIQEFFAARELTALTGRVAAAGAPAAGGAAPVPALPEAAGPGALPDLPPADLVFGRTVPEQSNDLRHREARAVEVELLYDGRGNARFLGEKARVYLVSFEIGLLPSRQSRWLYPVHWVQSLFLDHYDFTRGWFANLDFQMLGLDGGESGEPLVEVYDLMPRYDVLTAREAASNAQQLQLVAAAAAQGGAAQIDYLRRLEEQFAQQRRYPLQLGMIEHETAWSWAFGTRRQLRRRSPLVAWIPFVGRYAVESRLEPGMRTAHAILLVRDYDALDGIERKTTEGEESQAPELIGLRDFRGTHAKHAERALRDAAESAASSAATENARKEGKATIPVLVSASYMKLDQPTRRIPVPIRRSKRCTGKHCELARLVRLELDLAPTAGSGVDPTDVARIAEIEPTGGNRALVTIAIDSPDAKLRANALRRVEIRDETRKRLLAAATPEVFDDQTVNALVELPAKPAGDSIQLGARVVTSKHVFRTARAREYEGPWHAVPPGKIQLAPDSGGTGTQIRFDIPEDLRRAKSHPVNAADVTQVLFGNLAIPKGSHGWWIAPDKERFSFMVPPPPKGARVVDVVVLFGNGRPPQSVGPFSYR